MEMEAREGFLALYRDQKRTNKKTGSMAESRVSTSSGHLRHRPEAVCLGLTRDLDTLLASQQGPTSRDMLTRKPSLA